MGEARPRRGLVQVSGRRADARVVSRRRGARGAVRASRLRQHPVGDIPRGGTRGRALRDAVFKLRSRLEPRRDAGVTCGAKVRLTLSTTVRLKPDTTTVHACDAR